MKRKENGPAHRRWADGPGWEGKEEEKRKGEIKKKIFLVHRNQNKIIENR